MVQQLKPKKERTFEEWFEITTKKNPERNHLMVPPHILSLSCGCQRSQEEKPFEITKTTGGWIHFGFNHLVKRKEQNKKDGIQKDNFYFVPNIIGC